MDISLFESNSAKEGKREKEVGLNRPLYGIEIAHEDEEEESAAILRITSDLEESTLEAASFIQYGANVTLGSTQ